MNESNITKLAAFVNKCAEEFSKPTQKRPIAATKSYIRQSIIRKEKSQKLRSKKAQCVKQDQEVPKQNTPACDQAADDILPKWDASKYKPYNPKLKKIHLIVFDGLK